MRPKPLIWDLLFGLRGATDLQLLAHQTGTWHQLSEEIKAKAEKSDAQTQFTPAQSG